MTRLREIRERRAMTQAELAEKAGIHRITVVRLERDADTPVLPSTVKKLAKALKVDPALLFDPLDGVGD